MSAKLAYTLQEAADAVGMKLSALRAIIAKGDLAVKYPNSKPVIPADELKAWLDSLPSEAPGK
jgi:hypothetical protein